MANSASDARGSEHEIRRKLIEDRSVDVIIAVGTNMFYTVTLPVTLWFLDRSKRHTDRADQVLFIDAREIYNQIDRAHRDWTPQQIEFLANIVRLWRDEQPKFDAGSDEMLSAVLPDGTYNDVAGRCYAATVEEIEEQGWSLNPARYVHPATVDADPLEEDINQLRDLTEQLRELTSVAHKFEAQILGVAGEFIGARE